MTFKIVHTTSLQDLSWSCGCLMKEDLLLINLKNGDQVSINQSSFSIPFATLILHVSLSLSATECLQLIQVSLNKLSKLFHFSEISIFAAANNIIINNIIIIP